jgi:UTP---glucose-1-phosphate uridylyltransferase
MKTAIAEESRVYLRQLLDQLQRCPTDEERASLLSTRREQRWHDPHASLLTSEERLVVEIIYAIGEGERLFGERGDWQKFQALVTRLTDFHHFYLSIGGIIGYQLAALDLLAPANPAHSSPIHYSDPHPIEITSDSLERRRAIAEGIRRLPQMAEIYVVGGAGDRLGLCDEKGAPLPVALLPFDGRTLLEGLIRDLEGREQLYERLHGKRLCTPVVMLTSQESDNHAKLLALCEEKGWFGRPRNSFFLLVQPSVPVITPEGDWFVRSPLDLVTRPGGHGVLWKVMEEQGAFDWLESRGRSRAWVRQINNPLAGIDCGLLALAGYGWLRRKRLGFATCPRLVGASEGMVVAVECDDRQGITNVEYTDFERRGLQDSGREPGSNISRYPANTNILFVDLSAARRVVRRHPFPGMVLNLSKKLRAKSGEKIMAGRLETTMQNIADYLMARVGEEPPIFLTYNDRGKTISVAKKRWEEGSSIAETPEGAFADLQKVYRQLLKGCGVAVEEEVYISLHPALGPLWSVVEQKVRGGDLRRGSELRLELVDLDWERVKVEGSLIVQGGGSVTLRSVTVANRGVDWERSQPAWRGDPVREEAAILQVEAGGELLIEEVQLIGGQLIEVRAGERVVMTGDKIERHLLSGKGWRWRYEYDSEQRLRLRR